MGKRNLNLELFVVVSWMNSWVSPFIIPDIICFGFFTLDTRMVKFFMKLGVKFHSFFLEKKGEIFVPFTLFEKWKWNENDWKSRSRSESEIKMTRDRDREVKFQKKSREFSRIETLAGHCLNDIHHLCSNFYLHHCQHNHQLRPFILLPDHAPWQRPWWPRPSSCAPACPPPPQSHPSPPKHTRFAPTQSPTLPLILLPDDVLDVLGHLIH